MAMVGHKTESIYRRYAIQNAVALKDPAVKLAALNEATAEEPGKVAAFRS